MKENPFNVNPDPRYLFLTHHTQEALACLTYGIETRKGFILLTGEVGTGKTTMLNVLSDYIPEGERLITIEESAELQLRLKHTVTLETRASNAEGSGEVRIRDLVRNILHFRTLVMMRQ